MKIIILIISLALFWAEWYIIRKTTVNKWVLLLAELIVSLPLAGALGLHLVVFPLTMTILALFSCEFEDWLNKHFRKKGLTEVEQSKLRDL